MSFADTTLLTVQEAVTYGPGDAHLSGNALLLHISTQEEKLFNNRFGWAFYEKMLGDRYRYQLRGDGLPADDGNGNRYYYYIENKDVAVVTGDFVLSGDVVYKAIRDVDADNITAANVDYFQRADKFKTECFEKVYRRYLRGILALSVARTAAKGQSFRLTSRGAVKQYEEGKSKPLSDAEINALKAEYQGDLEDMIANMERYIGRTTGDCFSLYGNLGGSDCETDTEDGRITPQSGAGRRSANYGFSFSNGVR